MGARGEQFVPIRDELLEGWLDAWPCDAGGVTAGAHLEVERVKTPVGSGKLVGAARATGE
jgi:hypothetical protein